MFAAIALYALTMTTDPQGPIEFVVPTVGRQSVSATTPVRPISPKDVGPGVGKWIWSPTGKDRVIRFRKTISLSKSTKTVRAWIAADVRYRLWINGHLAARGPADTGRDYDSPPCGPWFEDVRDFTKLFHPGNNEIAAEVIPFAVAGNEWPLGHPGFKLDLSIAKAKGVEAVGTDESWLTAVAEDLDQSGANSGFRFDMTREPAGWQINKPEPNNWLPAVINLAQLPTLVSELPPALEVNLKPKAIKRTTPGVFPDVISGGAKLQQDGSYSVSYGHVLSGYIGLAVDGVKGARLLITPNEHDAPGYNRRFEVLLRDGYQVLETPLFDSFSTINIQLVGATKPVQIHEVRCTFTSFPVQYSGEFACSKPELNRLWEVCRWCTQICMQTHFLDSPHHQEPVSDAGDYLIESLNAFYAFGDGTLARQDLKKIGRNLVQRGYKSFHTSYSLLWLRMLMQYYTYTGDVATVQELAPTAFALLDQFKSYIGSNGLISNAPNYMFMDWVQIEGFNCHHPPAVIGQGYMTAIYYRALDDGKHLAAILSDLDRVEELSQLQRKVGAAFESELWSEADHLYLDGKPNATSVKPNEWMPADKDIRTFSTQVNSLAVWSGLATGKRATEVMSRVMARKDLNCQPYFMHFVFGALGGAKLLDEHLMPQLQRWHIEPDTQSFYEMWGTGDLSHAWNASPLYQLSGVVLGVRPIQPGYKEFEVSPNLCGLEWAKGKVPTPHGEILVSCRRLKGLMTVSLVVPPDTHAICLGERLGPGTYQLKAPTP